MRLGIDVLGAEQLSSPVSCTSALDLIDKFAATVVALARIAFRVLVGEDRTGGFENRLADEVFRGNELQRLVLPSRFCCNRRGNRGIYL